MTTKEKIIYAGFKQLLKTPFDSVSVNGIAKTVGISKPAIYKHFKSKEQIFKEMQTCFFNELISYLHKSDISFQNISEHTCFDRLESLAFVHFFCEHPGYLNYFIRELIYDKNFETSFQNFFIKEKIISPDFFCKNKEQFLSIKNEDYLKIVFRISTVNCFISEMHSYLEQNNLQMPSDFPDKVFDLVKTGWKKLNPISKERMQELESIVTSSKVVSEPSSKFFIAVADVVNEYGFQGLTMEKIASKMGLAVSTLYAHYDNNILN